MKLKRLLGAACLLLAGTVFAADSIDINTADAAALAQLNGIGAAKAEAIVAYREANGPFASVDDLTRVGGIGPATVEKNRDRISVGTAE